MPLHAFALLHWRLWLSLNCRISSKYPFQHHSSPLCWSCALMLWSRQQILVPQGQELMQVGTCFPKVRRMLLFHAPSILTHSASRAPCSCHSVSSWDRSSNFRALGQRQQGSPGQTWPSWISHVRLVSACPSSSGEWTSAASCLEIRNPIILHQIIDVEMIFVPTSCHSSYHVSLMDRDIGRQRVLFHANHLSSAQLHFGHHSFWTFQSAVLQPDGVHMSTFPQNGNHSWYCRTSILEGAIFHKMSYYKFLLGNPCKAIETFSPLWIFSSGTSGSRWFSLIPLHERIRKRIWCNFSTLTDIVAETAIVSFHALPVVHNVRFWP